MQAHRLSDVIGGYKFGREKLPLAKLIATAEKFEVPSPDREHYDDKVQPTIVNLEESEALGLPYDRCYFECVARNSDGLFSRVGVLATRDRNFGHGGYSDLKDLVDDYTLIFFTESLTPEVKGWSKPFVMNLSDDQNIMIGPFRGMSLGPRLQAIGLVGIQILLWCIFILNVRGISKINYSKPDKLNKQRLLRRKTPIDKYTKVLLPGYVDRLKKNQIGTFEDPEQPTKRHRMALHWRLGHTKRVAYGINHSLRKIKFIKPYMAGYEEEGRIYHLQYGQELTAETIGEIIKEDDNEHPDNT